MSDSSQNNQARRLAALMHKRDAERRRATAQARGGRAARPPQGGGGRAVEQRLYQLADQYLAQARQQLAAEGYENAPPSMLVEEVMSNTGARSQSPAFRDLVTMRAGGASNAQIQPFTQYWKNKGSGRNLGLSDYYNQYGVTDQVTLPDGGVYDGGDRSTGYGGISRVDANDPYMARQLGYGSSYSNNLGTSAEYNGGYNDGSPSSFAPHYGRNYGNSPGLSAPLASTYGGYYGPGSGQWTWHGGPYGRDYNYGNSRSYSSPPAFGTGYGPAYAGAPAQNLSPYGQESRGYGSSYPLNSAGYGSAQGYSGGQGYNSVQGYGYHPGGYGTGISPILAYYSPENPSNPFMVRGIGVRVGLRPIAQGVVQMGVDRLPPGFSIENNTVVAYTMDASGYPKQRVGFPFTLPVVQQGFVSAKNGAEQTLASMLREFTLWMQYHIPLQRQAQKQMVQNVSSTQATVQPGTNPPKINITMGPDGLPLQ